MVFEMLVQMLVFSMLSSTINTLAIVYTTHFAVIG